MLRALTSRRVASIDPVALPSSLWAAAAKPARTFPRLTGEVRADVAIVGGGYTGLSAALNLAEAGKDVVLLEAAETGWGASGRNGGQVIPGLKQDPDKLEEIFGPYWGPRVVKTVSGAADATFSLIARLGIQCDARQRGWIQPAHTVAALGEVEERARQWKARGANVAVVDRAETGRLLGTTAYLGAWIDHRGGSLQPLDYARGLAGAASMKGALIFERTRATGLAASGEGWRIETDTGSVRADRAILATNAYTDTLWPGLRRTVIPVVSQQVATVPLPKDISPAILPEGHVATDTRRILRYFRLDSDGRLLFGSRGLQSEGGKPDDVESHTSAVLRLFPQLQGVKFEHCWSGRVAMTADHLPHLHELAPGLFAALGCNGRGIAISTVMGGLIAQFALGRSAEEIDYPARPMKPLPLHGLNRIAVEAVAQYYRLRDAWG